jgi:tetratricopeptide (TPR) repeat protein
MEQHVSNGVAVQIAGDENTVTIFAGRTQLSLEKKHKFQLPPARDERDLLMTERRITEFVGRAAELQLLESWLRGPSAIACACLTGSGGAGKTRLAIELCERAEAQGWIAGFLRHDELKRFYDQQSLADWRSPKPTFIIVDYAAASASRLREWLEALAPRLALRDGAPALRLLLLERHADCAAGWWHDLTRPGGMTGLGPDRLADPAEPIALPSLGESADRRALLERMMQEAARIKGISPAPVPPAPGRDAEFDRRLADRQSASKPLYLMMAGIVAVTTGAPAALSFNRVDLSVRMAEAERSRLDRHADGIGLDRFLFRHFATCVTLQGGCSTDAAKTLIEQECAALGDRSPIRPGRIGRCLAEALRPAQGDGIDAVRPDAIGEAFLLLHLAEGEFTASDRTAILDRAFDRAGMPVIETLIRTAQDLAAGKDDHPTVNFLAHLARRTEDDATLTAITDALPKDTLALREQAAELTARLVEIRRALAADRPDAFRADLAVSLNNLSNRLADLGRREAALDASEQAAELYRALAADRPDAFRPALAVSLNNLSLRLADLGRREAALDASEQAAELYRALAADRPDAFRPDLAMSLNNLSLLLADLGRREAALDAIEQAAELYRALAADRPDAFRPALASALNNLSLLLAALGRREAALDAIEQAAELYRALAADRPDAFRPALAASLNNLSLRLAALGRREAALDAIEQAVEIRRALAADQPDAFRPALALSLWVMADRWDEANEKERGLAANAEAIAILSEPFREIPQAHARRMSGMIEEYRARSTALGRAPDEALLGPILAVLAALPESARD